MANQNTLSESIAIIVLNWNGKNDTLECLSSVSKLDYPNYEIIVVDNDSSDGSVEAIRTAYPNVVLLKSGENLGYAGGNNVGIRWALEHKTDYILILNNDTVVASDLLSVFLRAALSLPTGSVLGAKIYYYDKPNVIWYAGAHWNCDANSFKITGMQQSDKGEFNQIVKADYITGCVLFSAAETFNQVGLFDEDFFLTYEETDWCYRAKSKCFECFVIPDAHVWHKVSASFGGRESPLMKYFMTRNKYLWMSKHIPAYKGLRLHAYILCDLYRQIVPHFKIMKSTYPLYKELYWSGHEWLSSLKRNLYYPILMAKLLGSRDYYLKRFGNCPDKIRLLNKL